MAFGDQALQQFLQEIALKFMNKSSKDLSVCLCNGNLYTDLHIKATECDQYLKYMLSDPEHTKKSIVYSQTLYLSRLCLF